MSFISVSPGEIFAASKSLYRLWQESKNARERHRQAREFANCARITFRALKNACNALGAAGDELRPQLDIIKRAHDDLDAHLGRFDASFAQPENTHRMRNVPRHARWVFAQLDHRVEHLQSTLTTASTMCSLAMVPYMSLQISSIHQKILTQAVEVVEPTTLSQERIFDDAKVAQIIANACWQRPMGCYCRCHIRQERPWHSTLLGTIGLASFFDSCNRDTCDTRRYAVYVRFALSHFGVPLAIRLATELKVFGGFVPVLYPTIDVQRVCSFTSPGFKVLEELSGGFFGMESRLDADERTQLWEIVKESKVVELKRLFASGEASALDVDPDGYTWLEKLLRYPWPIRLRSAQFELLNFLGRHCKQDILSNPRLLLQISRWIGEGPHLDVLCGLITLGLDPGAMDASLFHIWPRFSDPNWQAECFTPDPFGVEFLRQCLKLEPEFADCDFLITHLLFGSNEDFERALQTWIMGDRSTPVNVLGQSAVHLAVQLPSRLKRLIHVGMDPDAVDRGGTTPLMYAAAYGQLDSVITLVQHVSRLDFWDKLNGRSFVHYAIQFRHIDLIEGLVRWFRDEGEAETALNVLDHSIYLHLVYAESSFHYDVPTLKTLLDLGGDPDVECGDEGTAMHLVNGTEYADVLLDRGFTAAGVQDNGGKTALMHVIRFFDPGLTEQLLYRQSDAGILIDQRDSSHWSAMLHLVGQSRQGLSRSWDTTEALFQRKTNVIKCMNLLLRHGADILLTDTCECPCSPSGCSAMSIALHHALEGIRPVSHRKILDTLPIDLCVELILLACSDNRLRQLADTVATYSDFIQSGGRHSCCALRSVRPLLLCTISGAHATDSQIRITEHLVARTGAEAIVDEEVRLSHQLARFYTLLELRSRARYDDDLATRIKRVLFYGPKNPRVGHYRSKLSFENDLKCLPAQRLDLQDYRTWISDCENKRSQMHTGKSLQDWVKNASEFVDELDREMERLRLEAC